jgi:hypothetical protein
MGEETKGVILYNRGNKCIVRAIVCLYSLRKHWDGNVTFFLEEPYPKEFEDVCKHFNVDVSYDSNPDQKALVRSAEVCLSTPYDLTMWLDADCLIVGKIDEMFDYLEEFDIAIPWFAGWWTDGGTISKRIKRYKGIAEDHFIEKAIQHNPSVNTGIFSYRKGLKFMTDWIELAKKGDGKMFIPDETAFQVLYPSAEEKIFIASTDFNVSVLHDKGQSKDPRIIHYHGQKHVLNNPTCDLWKETFKYMCEHNIANINHFAKNYPDKRLKRYIKAKESQESGYDSETTIVTACDEYYVDILQVTYPNWKKYKKIDKYPVIVFVNGMDEKTDPRLEFLRKEKNVKLIPWDMPNAESQREKMLHAFVVGASEHVKTDYWLKLDADSYATDDRLFVTEEMKKYKFCGHKWGYSRPYHIKKLDEWAKGHKKKELNSAPPMINEGESKGRRFYHKGRRTISFIQLHQTKFTKFCVNLLGSGKRMPAPTQDTYMYYVAKRFSPDKIGTMNFKRNFGFTQGRGRSGAEAIANKIAEMEEKKKT